VRTTARRDVDPDTSSAGEFDPFFRRTFPGVARTAALVVGDMEGGQDMAQEAFTRVYPRWDRMASEAHATNFVYRVAINLARSHLRKERVRGRLRLPHRIGAGIDEGESAADRITLAQAVDGLSPRQRVCVALVDYAGFDADAAADVLGLRSSTIRVHLSRGRRTLAERLGATYRGGPPDE
jgi:RNA polymerase sigma-70 factor (ECF subfamily)